MAKDSLVTGTPIIEKKPFNLALFFEYAKLVQRVVMVILTIAVLFSLYTASNEIKALRIETARIANIAEKGYTIAEETRTEIYKQIEEMKKNGIKFKIRLW